MSPCQVDGCEAQAGPEIRLGRRALITGLVSLIAAPAIVRYASLMPVSNWMPIGPVTYLPPSDALRDMVTVTLQGFDAYGEAMVETREISMLAWVDGRPILSSKQFGSIRGWTISGPPGYPSSILEHPDVIAAQKRCTADLRRMWASDPT